jgi:hypothetical protein
MSNELRFNSIAYDSTQLPLGSPSTALFVDRALSSHERVTDIDEEKTLSWLLCTPPVRKLVFANLGLTDAAYARISVREPILDHRPTKKPGDLDVLLLPSIDDPSHAISIQAKRIKVKAVDTYRDNVTNRHLGNLTDLIEQANGSRELGFHLNYAMVIVQVDGERRSDFNFFYRTTSPGQFNRIYHRTRDRAWHPDVGIIFVEIAQPTADSIHRAGLVGICVDKLAREIEQHISLTAKVRQLTVESPNI